MKKQEIVKSKDLYDHYRILADTRDLNYKKFFFEGETKIIESEEYTSHNTFRLNLEETKNILLKLSIVREDCLNEIVDYNYEP